jgi:phage tail P2-like protein
MSDLLPPNATRQERALSLATARAVPMPIRSLWSPQSCPEGVLPWLAWALSVDEWDSTWPVDRKRQSIAESIEVHRRKGTIGALRRALEQLGYEVEIDEKTGEAYTFRLLFKVGVGAGSAGGALLDEAITRATSIALRQKNARSELVGSLFLAENGAKGGPIIACGQLSGSETDVERFRPTEFDIHVSGLLDPPAFGVYELAGVSNGRFVVENLDGYRIAHNGTAWQFISPDDDVLWSVDSLAQSPAGLTFGEVDGEGDPIVQEHLASSFDVVIDGTASNGTSPVDFGLLKPVPTVGGLWWATDGETGPLEYPYSSLRYYADTRTWSLELWESFISILVWSVTLPEPTPTTPLQLDPRLVDWAGSGLSPATGAPSPRYV